jgi:hypothetical protein
MENAIEIWKNTLAATRKSGGSLLATLYRFLISLLVLLALSFIPY